MRVPLSIQSRNNPRIKAIASLKEGKHRRTEGKFLVEGLHEIRVALQYRHPIETVVFTEPKLITELESLIDDRVELLQANRSVFEKISMRQHPEGVLAVCGSQILPGVKDLEPPDRPILILDGLEKPGNHGAILRSAAAFGMEEIILNDGQLDPYHPNVIRNSRGHSLGFRHFQDTREATLNWLKEHGYHSYVASPEAESAIEDLKFERRTAIILGSEHAGVSHFWKNNAENLFRIPMTTQVDSLNVSVSASIVLYEVFKQSIRNA